MTLYRNHFLTKDHSYYDDASVLIHQTFCPWEGDYWDETFELHCVSGERFENRVKIDWPNVKLKHQYMVQGEYVEYEYHSDSGFNILSGSVNGILGLFCVNKVNILLWNPSTEEFKIVPQIPLNTYHHEFGYDQLRNDYKVMSIGDVAPSGTFREIYSLRTNSWRKLDVEIDYIPNYWHDNQVYIDGFSHWLCQCETHNEQYNLISFDWSNEVFVTTPVASNMDDNLWMHLVLLNGSIALISNYTELDTFHISILGEFGVKESWTRIFIIGPLACLEYPIGIGKKGDMLFRKKDGGLVWFDLNTQMIEDLGITTDRFSCKIVIHKENLLPFEGNYF